MFRHLLTTSLLLLALSTPVTAQSPCTHYASPAGGGDGSSPGAPLRLGDFFGVARPGATLCLLDGTYSEGVDAVNVHAAPGSPITIRALHDGGVYLNGQYARNIFFFNGASYLTVQGIDGGNGPPYNAALGFNDSHHITVQRVCVWNANRPRFVGGEGSNQHVIGVTNSHHLLLEDVCGFGYGRNTFIPFEDASRDNVFRRIWVRWDGWEDNNGGTCPAPTIQTQYHTYHTNDTYENFISIFSGALYGGDHPAGFPCPSFGGGWVTRSGILGSPAAGGSTP